MQQKFRIEGVSGLLMHSVDGVRTDTEIARKIAILAKKKASSRTEAENQALIQLECAKSVWSDDPSKPIEEQRPVVPERVIRAVIETAARKFKEGPEVREGLVVTNTQFEYDVDRYGESIADISTTAQFTTPVVVQRSRIERTRALFEPPWSVVVEIDTDDELIDDTKLLKWLDVAGRRLGIGDWRPAKGGSFGRFQLVADSLVNL